MEQGFHFGYCTSTYTNPKRRDLTCFVMSMVFSGAGLMDNSAWSNVQSSITDLTLQFVLTIDK